MPWWSTTKDEETSVQSDEALTHDSQRNNLDRRFSAWVLIENICVVNRETVFVCLIAPKPKNIKRDIYSFFSTHKFTELYQRYLIIFFFPKVKNTEITFRALNFNFLLAWHGTAMFFLIAFKIRYHQLKRALDTENIGLSLKFVLR